MNDISPETLKEIAHKKSISWFRKKHFHPDADDKTIIFWIVQLAMSHPDTVSGWMRDLARYSNDEGFDSESLQKDLMVSRIIGRKEYRRVKILG